MLLHWLEPPVWLFIRQLTKAKQGKHKQARDQCSALLLRSSPANLIRWISTSVLAWEKCVCADLKVLGQDEGSWEASCQIKSAWRKRLWDLTHPWESQRLVRCRRRTKQAIDKHVERYVVPFSGWEDGGSPVPWWWEPPPAPTRVVLDPAASPPPMCDGSGAGFGF